MKKGIVSIVVFSVSVLAFCFSIFTFIVTKIPEPSQNNEVTIYYPEIGHMIKTEDGMRWVVDQPHSTKTY